MNELRIRPFEPEDQNAVINLWHACGLVVPHNNPKRDIARKCRVNPEWFLVGEQGGRVVATCMVGYEGHRGWVNYLAVSLDHRCCGIATRMMKRAEEILFSAGCPKINLQVRESNQDIITFYEHMGYVNDRVVSLGKRLEHDQPR